MYSLQPILSGLELTIVPQIVPQIDQPFLGQNWKMTDDALTPAIIFLAVADETSVRCN
jgi:hypothetical protein